MHPLSPIRDTDPEPGRPRTSGRTATWLSGFHWLAAASAAKRAAVRPADPATARWTRSAASGCAPPRTPGTAHVAVPGLAAELRAAAFADSLAPRGMKSMATRRGCAFGRNSRTRAQSGSRPFGARVEGYTRRQSNPAVDGLVRRESGPRDARTVPAQCLESGVIPFPSVEGEAQSLERSPAGICRSRCPELARSRRNGNPFWDIVHAREVQSSSVVTGSCASRRPPRRTPRRRASSSRWHGPPGCRGSPGSPRAGRSGRSRRPSAAPASRCRGRPPAQPGPSARAAAMRPWAAARRDRRTRNRRRVDAEDGRKQREGSHGRTSNEKLPFIAWPSSEIPRHATAQLPAGR